MKLALLGDDPVVLPLIRVLSEHQVHRLTAATLLGDLQAEVLGLVPAVRMVSGWEEFIPVGTGCRDCLRFRQSDREASKQLAMAGRPLVVFPQGGWDTELIYELSLLRDDNGVNLIPVCPRLLHPAFQADSESVTGYLQRMRPKRFCISNGNGMWKRRPANCLRTWFDPFCFRTSVCCGCWGASIIRSPPWSPPREPAESFWRPSR